MKIIELPTKDIQQNRYNAGNKIWPQENNYKLSHVTKKMMTKEVDITKRQSTMKNFIYK